MAAKKKMSRMERDLLVEQMDRDLEEFILQKIEANKDRPREPFDFKKIEEVCSVLSIFLGCSYFVQVALLFWGVNFLFHMSSPAVSPC